MKRPQQGSRVADCATVSRNEPCPCGSGRKYKHCCGGKQPAASATVAPLAQSSTGASPLLGPMTEVGRFLATFPPVQQAFTQRQVAPARSPTSHEPAAAEQRRRSAQAHLNQAARLEAAGRQTDAITALQTAARLTPDDPIAHYNLGLTCAKANRLPEAIASLRQAIGLQPDFGRAQFRLGVVLQDLGHGEAAIEALRTAIALGARRKEAHARLGELLQARGNLAEAAESYRQAAGDSTRGRLYRAKALMVEENFDEAAALVRRALALDPNSPEAEWMLGNLLVTLGRINEAMPHLERAIALAPEAVSAFDSLASARRLTAADRPLVDRMTAVLETASLGDIARLRLEYALGKAFDDLQDYAAAIRHFDAANRIEKALSSYERAQQASWVDLLIARCSPDYFTQHAGLGVDDETPVFVLGMPRSGTTLVEQIVSSHKLVAGGGELEFWLRRGPAWEHAGPDGLTVAATQLLADDYRAELRRVAPDAVRVIDKMPHNFMWIGLIHLVFPRARIIHCRRNPVDTCLSIYFTQFVRRMNFASDRGDLVFEYRQYERLMAHWRAVLSLDRFLEVNYEALVADQEASTRRLIAFCGLDWDDACLRPEANRRTVQTASVWQARQPVYRSSVERWRNYEPWLGELRELLPPDKRPESATPRTASSE
jgi:tetratricopeptide (TPR) repeat protein